MKTSLIRTIFSGAWALDPNGAQAFFPIVKNLLEGKPLGFEPPKENFQILGYNQGHKIMARAGSSAQKSGQKTDEKLVAIIPMKDVMLKYDEACGPVGTQTIASYVQAADQDPSIQAIVLDIDGPGGQADAVPLLAQTIQDASKPVLAYTGNGIAASAHYYIAAVCDEIYATFKSDQVGSIGSMASIVDMIGYYEKKGIKIHEIYGTKSTEKNKIFNDVLKGEYEGLRTEWIDPLVEEFEATVKAHRPSIDESALHGKMYYAKEALDLGLIDGLLSFEEVITRAFELGENNQSKSNQNSTSMSLFGKNKNTTAFSLFMAFVGKKPEERTQEEFEAVNTELAESGLGAFLVEATEEIDSAEKPISSSFSRREISQGQ